MEFLKVKNKVLILNYRKDVTVRETLSECTEINRCSEVFVEVQLAEDLPRGKGVILGPGTSDTEIGLVVMKAKHLPMVDERFRDRVLNGI